MHFCLCRRLYNLAGHGIQPNKRKRQHKITESNDDKGREDEKQNEGSERHVSHLFRDDGNKSIWSFHEGRSRSWIDRFGGVKQLLNRN